MRVFAGEDGDAEAPRGDRGRAQGEGRRQTPDEFAAMIGRAMGDGQYTERGRFAVGMARALARAMGD